MAGSDVQGVLGPTGALGVLAGVMDDAGPGEVLLQDVVGGGEGQANLELAQVAVLILQAGDVLQAGVVVPVLLPLFDRLVNR